MGKRSLSQNAIFHVWCKDASDHLIEAGIDPMNEDITKQIFKQLLGNTSEVFGLVVTVSTTKYTHDDRDLTQEQIEAGEISMEEFLTKVVVWCATEINLVLVSPNEETLV